MDGFDIDFYNLGTRHRQKNDIKPLETMQEEKAHVMANEWVVYIIEAKSGKLYTGITNNLEKRFAAHQKGKGASFFHFSSPRKIVYTESHPSRGVALKREIEIKKMKRDKKLELINNIARFDPVSDEMPRII